MLYFTVFVFRVQLQKTMRIGPEPFSHGSFDTDFGSGCVGRVSVVCEQRKGNRKDANNHQENDRSLVFHAALQVSARTILALVRGAELFDEMDQVLSTVLNAPVFHEVSI